MTKFQMNCARSPLAVAMGLALLGGAPTWAASADYLLKLDTVEGESKMTREIQIESFSFGASNVGQGCRGSVGPGEATLAAPTRVPTGKVIKKAILHIRKAGGDATTAIELENVMITSVAAGRPMKMTYARASWSGPNCLASR